MKVIKCWSAFCFVFLCGSFYPGPAHGVGTGIDGDITASSLTVTGLVTMSSIAVVNTLTISSGSVTNFTISTGAAGNFTITNSTIANLNVTGTILGLTGRIVQTSTFTTTTSFDTTSNSFQITNLQLQITPKSASNVFLVCASGPFATFNAATDNAYAAIFRDSTNLAGSNGHNYTQLTGGLTTMFSICLLDIPNNSPVTYSVRIRADGNGAKAEFGLISITQQISLMEVSR